MSRSPSRRCATRAARSSARARSRATPGPIRPRQRRQRESEEQFRMLADNIAPARLDRRAGRAYRLVQQALVRIHRHDAGGDAGLGLAEGPPSRPCRAGERAAAASRSPRGEEWEDTFPLRGADGEYRWFLSRAKPIRDEAGEIVSWFGTNTDITEQREQAEQIRLLLMEVNHRSKNMLTTIQALARRSSPRDEGFIARFEDRVQSLGDQPGHPRRARLARGSARRTGSAATRLSSTMPRAKCASKAAPAARSRRAPPK